MGTPGLAIPKLRMGESCDLPPTTDILRPGPETDRSETYL